MRNFNKKMLISILTSVVVLITIVATTFAWVGIFTYANTDNFDFNLRVSELDVNYFLQISATGEEESFGDEADSIEIKRQILKNEHKWEDSKIDALTNDEVELSFSKNSILKPSTTLIENNQLTKFKCIDMNNHAYFDYIEQQVMYFEFDVYLTANTKEGINNDNAFINSNVYLTELENTLKGTIAEYRLFNHNPFKELPSANSVLKSLPDNDKFKLDSANATRFALTFYNPINMKSSYTGNESPIKTLIYQGGTQEPSVVDDVYNLGGNLPEDSNTALQELLVIRPSYNDNNYMDKMELYHNSLNDAVERGQNDLELIEENSKVWAKPTNASYTIDDDGNYKYNYIGFMDGMQTKQKITVRFWFEGWDSDCLAGIDQKAVQLNLTFTAGVND